MGEMFDCGNVTGIYIIHVLFIDPILDEYHRHQENVQHVLLFLELRP